MLSLGDKINEWVSVLTLPVTETKVEEGQTELKSCDGGAPTKGVTAALSPTPTHHNPFAPAKGEKVSWIRVHFCKLLENV